MAAYNDAVPSTPERQPDFGAIFSSLRQEVSRASELAGGTNYLANSLKPMLADKENSSLAQKDEPGIVGMLWVEIGKLRDANNLAERNQNHLREIVGS